MAGEGYTCVNSQGSVAAESAHFESARQLSDQFFFVNVVLLVENCLYQIPQRTLEADSEVFRNMFEVPLPCSDRDPVEGTSLEHPIHLQGIKRADFESLLKVLFPPGFGRNPVLVLDEWVSVLKLSTMWEFTAIRQVALKELEGSNLDAGQKYLLAQECGVDQWLVPALSALAARCDPLSEVDVDTFGLGCVLKLARVRELGKHFASVDPPTCTNRNYDCAGTRSGRQPAQQIPYNITWRCQSCNQTRNVAYPLANSGNDVADNPSTFESSVRSVFQLTK